MNGMDVTTYTNLNSLTELKARAAKDPSAALGEVARQFESLFIHQMLKSMREANLAEGLLDNDQSLFYRDMFDQQISVHLAESGGIGLADVLTRQLGGNLDTEAQPRGVEAYRGTPVDLPRKGESGAVPELEVRYHAESMNQAQQPEVEILNRRTEPEPAPATPEEFVTRLWPWAREAAALLGLEPQMLLAQAALESGWGRHVMQHANGDTANNLFGIKADHRWDGEKVTVSTLEYEDGVAVRRRAHFRAYDSYRQSFLDYVAFLKADERYAKALQSTDDAAGFFGELQKAGYATDPNYANKISAVLSGDEMTRALGKLKSSDSQSL